MNNHLKPRPVIEWLEMIPFENARKYCLNNIWPSSENKIVDSLSDAIYNCYWYNNINRLLFNTIKHMEQSVKLKS